MPIFEQSGRIRFSGIVNDRAPLTFTWTQDSQAVLIPARLVRTAQIDVRNARQRQRRLADGRQVTVTDARLATLRFGKLVLRDVQVELLPPEAEDVGALISRSAFRDAAAEVQPAALRLVLTPNDVTKE